MNEFQVGILRKAIELDPSIAGKLADQVMEGLVPVIRGNIISSMFGEGAKTFASQHDHDSDSNISVRAARKSTHKSSTITEVHKSKKI